MHLVCPAGSLPALKAAVDHGANCVYLGLRDATNARNFAGLNFDDAAIATGVAYAHARGCQVFMALNTYPQAAQPERWREAMDKAVNLGVDAVILADPGLMRYATQRHPRLRLHLSVQGSATNPEAINLYHREFGISRAVLPRVVFSGLISNGDKTTVMMAQGVEPDAEFAVKGPSRRRTVIIVPEAA